MAIIKLKSHILDFTHIVHLSDIQIRLTKRHDEYREVFSKLFKSVSELPETTAICVVGDVVHNKLDLSPECVQLTKEFLAGLSDLRPTILVAGNHDTNLTNKSRLDSLSPIVEAMNHPNLFYLKESGLYSIGDICFNNYSVFDDETKYLNGQDIPSIYKNQYRHFVCLFHGTVDGAVSEMGFKLVNKSITLSLFNGHDIVLLGDIHKIQTLQEANPTVHYCGSLIQQNHGEDLKGHGYTLWNVKDKTYNHIEIPNDYGYFTIRVNKGQIITDIPNIPKKSRLRLSCCETLPTEIKAILKELKNVTEFIEPPTFTREDIKNEGNRSLTLTSNLVQGDLKNRDHQIKLITEYITNKFDIKDEELIKDIIKINDEINSEIILDDIAKNIKWSPIRFEWENLFSFGEDNVIDFTKVKDVVGLFAVNASGKSSVFSALSWCVFDKCERDFKANNIINDQKMSCRAQLEVEIGDVRYFIERVGKMDKKGNVKVNVKFWRIVDGKEENLTGIERSDTNNAIRSYIGSYEDFLLTSLSVQKSGKYETSFIDLGDSGRKDLLAQFLGLNIFDKLHEVSKEKLNDIVSTLKVYKNDDYEANLKSTIEALQQTTSMLGDENKKLADITEKKDKLQILIEEESKKYIKVDGCHYSSENEIVYAINQHKQILSFDEEQLKRTEEYQTKNKIVIDEINKKLRSLGDFDEITKKWRDWNDLNGRVLEKEKQFQFQVSQAKDLKENINKIKSYEYDPDCSFCVKNANEIILNGKKSGEKLEIFRREINDLMILISGMKVKRDETAGDEKKYWEYNELLRNKSRDQELYLKWQKEVDEINKKINKTKSTLELMEKQLEIFNKNKEAIENNAKINQIVSNIKKEISNLTTEHDRQFNRVRAFLGSKAIHESNIGKLNENIEKVKKIEKIYKAYDLYVQSVSRDGIPYEVITSAVPHIENEVNSILSQIVEFHSKFNIDGKNIIPYIVRDERHWLMSLGSGMEQFILSIAIRVALTNLSNIPRANFLIIDEGFGVLDAETLSTMQILFHFLKTNFDFIMVVSHINTLRDMVDSQIEIKKDNGFSKVYFV